MKNTNNNLMNSAAAVFAWTASSNKNKPSKMIDSHRSAVMTVWGAATAAPVAKAHAASGADPAYAAVRGTNYANAVMGWFVFILPVAAFMGFFGFIAGLRGNPRALICAGLIMLTVWLKRRLNAYKLRPIGQRPPYLLPTWLLASVGPIIMVVWVVISVHSNLSR